MPHPWRAGTQSDAEGGRPCALWDQGPGHAGQGQCRAFFYVHLVFSPSGGLCPLTCCLFALFVCQDCRNKPHRRAALNHRSIFSLGPGGHESKVKVSGGLVFAEGCEGESALGFRPWLVDDIFSLCLFTLSSLYACLCPNFPFL